MGRLWVRCAYVKASVGKEVNIICEEPGNDLAYKGGLVLWMVFANRSEQTYCPSWLFIRHNFTIL